MADVIPSDERAQLLLITAIAIGLVLVVLAVVLNTVMYTDALAAGGTTDGAERDLAAHLDGVDAGIGVLLVGINADRPAVASYDELEDEMIDAVHDWSAQDRAHWVRDGAYTSVVVTDVAVHTRIIDDNYSSDFTDATGDTDWTLVEDASTIDAAELNVTRAGLTEVDGACGPDDGCFTVVIEGEDGQSSAIRLGERAGEIVVDITTPDGETACTTDAASASLDLVNGTIDGQSCDGLAVTDSHQQPLRVQYANAANVTGTYTLAIDGTVVEDERFDEAGSPRLVPAVSSVEVAVLYQSARLTYTGTFTVSAGDIDG